MNADYFKTMLDYQYWCRDRLLAATDGMSDEELTKPNGFTYGSILGILAHCLGAEWIWFQRMHDRPVDPAMMPNKDNIKTLAGLKTRWQASEADWSAYIASAADMEREYVLRQRDGTERTWKLWQLLTMIGTHSKQHGSEAAEALTMAGHSPGDLDFPVFLRSRP
jgi:uncharacterized damage-inducible protein DinB